jgi:uncharacterized membrane protein
MANEIKFELDTVKLETAITQGVAGIITALDRLTAAVREQTNAVTGGNETPTMEIAPSAPVAAPAPAPVQVQPVAAAAPAPAPVQIPPVAAVPAPVPQAAAPTGLTYTLEQISNAAAPLMDAGRIQDLFNLLQKFGVQAVTQLKPDLYGQFATELRALGAKI